MNKITVLFILGSHRTNGNSKLIQELVMNNSVYKEIDAKYIFLKDYKINDCNSCYQCSDCGECVLHDDVGKIVNQMIASDVIIYVPVVYGFGLGSVMQKFIERTGYGFFRTHGRPLRDKIAGVVVIGRRYAHESVVQQCIMNIMLNEMVLYGSGFLPLLKGDSFPGNIMNDYEGIEAFDKMLNRVVVAAQKGR